MTNKEEQTAIITYPKGGVSCSKDSFWVNESLVIQIKFCGENSTFRQAPKRQSDSYRNVI